MQRSGREGRTSADLPVALVADADPATAEMVASVLRSAGFMVLLVRDGLEARRVWSDGGIDVLVLGAELPGRGGVELCREIRSVAATPVLIIAGSTDDADAIAGFEAGADEYVARPIEPRLLALRVTALLRRWGAAAGGSIRIGELCIDPLTHAVTVGSRTVYLSGAEWRLLSALVARPGEVLSWRHLLRTVWTTDEWVGGRDLVKSTVYRLRQRLGDGTAGPRCIETVPGSGYRIRTH